MSASPSPSSGVPLRGLVMLAWIGVYLLMMALSGWPWESASIWSYGAPPDATLERLGALVPARLDWTSFLLSPWLHRSLIGLVLYLLFFGGTARQVMGFAGVTRTWILFVAGGAAGAGAHALAHPESVMPAGAGPFDAIAALVGASLCWGLFGGSPLGPRVRNGAIVTILIVGGFTWYATAEAQGHPDIWTLIGLEAMLAAFGTGFLVMLLLGPRRSARPAPVALRRVAQGLLLALLAAGALQGVGVAASADRADAKALLDKLEWAEQVAYELSRDQARADERKRTALSRALEAVLAEGFLEGYEGEPALRAYVQALRAYQQPVRLPWVAEDACRRAFDTWYERHEKPLRESRGLSGRSPRRFYWEKE